MSEEWPLALALALTRAMLEAARAGDWEQVIALEDQRQPLAMQPVPQNEDSVHQLGELLALDREVQKRVSEARAIAADQWQAEHNRARAIAAYGK